MPEDVIDTTATFTADAEQTEKEKPALPSELYPFDGAYLVQDGLAVLPVPHGVVLWTYGDCGEASLAFVPAAKLCCDGKPDDSDTRFALLSESGRVPKGWKSL